VGNHEEKSSFWNLWTNFVPFFASFNFFWNLNMWVWLGFFYFCTPGINEKMLPNFGKEIHVLVFVFLFFLYHFCTPVMGKIFFYFGFRELPS
jgi:hypothetical protein